MYNKVPSQLVNMQDRDFALLEREGWTHLGVYFDQSNVQLMVNVFDLGIQLMASFELDFDSLLLAENMGIRED